MDVITPDDLLAPLQGPFAPVVVKLKTVEQYPPDEQDSVRERILQQQQQHSSQQQMPPQHPAPLSPLPPPVSPHRSSALSDSRRVSHTRVASVPLVLSDNNSTSALTQRRSTSARPFMALVAGPEQADVMRKRYPITPRSLIKAAERDIAPEVEWPPKPVTKPPPLNLSSPRGSEQKFRSTTFPEKVERYDKTYDRYEKFPPVSGPRVTTVVRKPDAGLVLQPIGGSDIPSSARHMSLAMPSPKRSPAKSPHGARGSGTEAFSRPGRTSLSNL